jgi:hypothetical protein
MLRQNPHLLLMGALGFSAQDLAANSRGELSLNQKFHLQGARNRQLEGWMIAIMLVWTLGLFLRAPLLVILFLTAASVTAIIALWQRVEGDLSEGIQTVSGRIARHEQWLPLPAYKVQVNETTFRVSREAGMAFAPGHIYRLYFTPVSRTILSAELVA